MNQSAASITKRRLAFFERYLTLWVFLCLVGGILLGKLAPAFTASLSKLELGHDSHVNVAIAVLIWLMIYPMMLKVDFTALGGIARKPKGLAVTEEDGRCWALVVQCYLNISSVFNA